MLALRHVSKRFSGIPAVDDVTFTAYAGEVTGYLGANGSGKSTTMKMITGLIAASSGEILFEGQPIHDDLIAFKQRMGYVPEEPHLYTHLSGVEYLMMVAQLRNLAPRQSAERIAGLLRLFGLHDDRYAPISAYSKGMRQKILLSAALMHNPDLILLDEPFSGLDNAMRNNLLMELREYLRQWKTPVLSVTHDIGEAFQLAAEVIKIADGCVVQQGPAATVLSGDRERLLEQLNASKKNPA